MSYFKKKLQDVKKKKKMGREDHYSEDIEQINSLIKEQCINRLLIQKIKANKEYKTANLIKLLSIIKCIATVTKPSNFPYYLWWKFWNA